MLIDNKVCEEVIARNEVYTPVFDSSKSKKRLQCPKLLG